jgi:nucleotide-binding universal stress UspA family protein
MKEVVVSFRKVLVAVDSEPVAVRAAETGVELAQALGAEIAFITVVDSLWPILATPGRRRANSLPRPSSTPTGW